MQKRNPKTSPAENSATASPSDGIILMGHRGSKLLLEEEPVQNYSDNPCATPTIRDAGKLKPHNFINVADFKTTAIRVVRGSGIWMSTKDQNEYYV